MKILTVSHFFEDHGGGIERVAAQLSCEFARSGHRATWAASTLDSTAPSGFERVNLKCFNPTETLTGIPMPIPGLRAFWTLRRAIRANDAVIIHDSLYFTSVIAAVIAKANGKKIVLVQHLADIEFRSRALQLSMRLANFTITGPMMAVADRLIFISDHVRRKLLGNPARRNFLLLYNGVDTDIFKPATSDIRTATRLLHGLPVDGIIVVFVGRLVEKKGLAILRRLAKARPDLHIAILGRGPINPSSWGLTNVQVLGQQSQTTVAELYRAADLLLLPSVGEGFPLVVQEAMACGLAVVCGNDTAAADPGASRWLRGVRIDLNDQSASALRCSEAIDQALSATIDAAAMARYAAATYNWPKMAEAIVGCLSNS